jgi:hypothetical protein
MYSPKVVARNLEEFEAREGWMPVYHSLDQVEAFKEKIRSITKVESNSKTATVSITRPITQKDKQIINRWILNEQVLCGLSFDYWASHYAYVCDEEGRIFKYQARMSQQVYDIIVSDFDEQGVSIELLILKGRQLGITTLTALKFIHQMLFVPHTQAIMASVKDKSSQLIGRILNTVYNECPWWLVPVKLPKWQFDNGSVLSIQSGMQATGLAQGWTPRLAHLSELADIPDPQKTIEEGLFRAMHTSPNLFMVLEGTGGGNTGWLADTWRSAKKNWPLGMSRLCPVFISWPMCPEIYPKDGWLKKFPVPGDFLERRLDSTAKHVAKCEAYIRNTPYLAKVMGRDYTMPLPQQWFYEFNYRQACENHTQKTWQSQMPADDFEALTGEHDPVFDLDVIDGIEGLIYEIHGNEKTRRVPVQSYAITGHDVDDEFYPREDQIDEREPIIEVSWNSNRGQHYEWQLVPLLPGSEDEEVNTMDRLNVYEWPKRGSMYTCGIDTADGLGQEDEDRTVISLSKNLFDGDSDRQVCEYTSTRVNAAQAVAFAACVGAWYGPACRDSRGVRFAIEQVGRPGETCQHQLKMMGFNWHYIPKRFDSKKIKDDVGKKEGWWSSSWSISILMTRFVEAVNGGWYIPKSRWLIEELRTLERHTKTGKSKMEHRAGQHDDRVRAAAQSYFCAHDMDILAERAQKKHAGPPKKSDNRIRPKAGSVSVGDDWD